LGKHYPATTVKWDAGGRMGVLSDFPWMDATAQSEMVLQKEINAVGDD
jgi:hypothetical protein